MNVSVGTREIREYQHQHTEENIHHPKIVMSVYQIHVMVLFKSDIEWRKIDMKVCSIFPGLSVRYEFRMKNHAVAQ